LALTVIINLAIGNERLEREALEIEGYEGKDWRGRV
jgi:hypothetical protein